jgi:hypothetical protein
MVAVLVTPIQHRFDITVEVDVQARRDIDDQIMSGLDQHSPSEIVGDQFFAATAEQDPIGLYRITEVEPGPREMDFRLLMHDPPRRT